MELTTTFNLLRKKGACIKGYRKLAKHLGGIEAYGEDTEINLLVILESNGFDDCVWSLRATAEPADKLKRLLAADFAETVLHSFEARYPSDDRPRKAIQATKDFANGLITIEELGDCRKHAYAAAADADADAAAYAAAYATDTAAAYAAYAADSAAYAAEADAAEADAAAYAAYTAAYAATAADADADAADAAAASAYIAKKVKKEKLTALLVSALS